ncbi:hypothetical protein RRG08_038335 [Elysia crispata]|uniref:Uncharacterized protein n=1 Tax=Elysia crispata TaxID=231223 RepID=A0AAE1E268_9GAST|nr:hypothetical protein RRG08_038335 [Elysia crispata]
MQAFLLWHLGFLHVLPGIASTTKYLTARGSLNPPGWQYDANALEFAHHREIYRRGKHKTSTGTYRDFEQSGIFEAQTLLEKVQKEEEDELYLQIHEERRKKVS